MASSLMFGVALLGQVSYGAAPPTPSPAQAMHNLELLSLRAESERTAESQRKTAEFEASLYAGRVALGKLDALIEASAKLRLSVKSGIVDLKARRDYLRARKAFEEAEGIK